MYQHKTTSGAMRSRTMKGSVNMSIFIRSPVILACSLPSMYMSWKWAAYSVDMVIIEVSATTVANLFHLKTSYNSVHEAYVRYIQVCACMCWYIRVCTGLYQYMLVCTSTYQHVLHIFPPVGIFGYKLEHARLSLLVLSHTALYPLVLFWIRGGTRRYEAVKFGTRR